MSSYKYHIKEIKFPKVPDYLIKEIFDAVETRKKSSDAHTLGDHRFPPQYDWFVAPDNVREWCEANISPEIVFGIQVITDTCPKHRDNYTKVKFFNNLSLGGDNVITSFFDDNDQQVTSIRCNENSWYLLNVAAIHMVEGIEPGKERIAITGRTSP